MKNSLAATFCIITFSISAQIYAPEIEVTTASNGNVGIGAISASAKFHISTLTGQSGFQLGDGSQLVTSQLYLKNNSTLGWGRHMTFEYDGAHYGHLAYDNEGFKWRIMNAADAFYFRNASNSTVFTINDAGKVGIGKSNPNQNLDVDNGTSSSTFFLRNGNNGDTYGLNIRSGGTAYNGGEISTTSGYNFNLLINNNGSGAYRLGINTTSPSYHLDVNGTIRVVSVIQTSDERLKEDISTYRSDNDLRALSVYRYKLKSRDAIVAVTQEPDGSPSPSLAVPDHLRKHHIGLMAQEVEQVYPDLVYTDEQGYKAIDYSQFIPILIEKTNKQQETIETLQERIAALEKQLKK